MELPAGLTNRPHRTLTFAASTDDQIPWELEIDLANSDQFGGLLALIAMAQSTASMRRPGEFSAICRAVASDILALRAAPPVGTDPLDLAYLQFEACLVPMQSAFNVGALGETHDWIVTGLGDDLAHGIERVIDPQRLHAFAASQTGWIAGNRRLTIPVWATCFFYLSRRSATLQDFGRMVLAPVLQIVDALPGSDPSVIDARGMMLSWAAIYAPELAPMLAGHLEAAFEDVTLSLPLRTRIAVIFAVSAPGLANRLPADWAAWAMGEGACALASHEPFQLIWHRIETLDDWMRERPEALAAAQYYAASLRRLQSAVAVAQATDQRSALLGPAFVKMTAFDRCDDLLAILQRWYDVRPTHALPGGALFVSPNHHAGTAWLGAHAQVLADHDPHQIGELTRLANAALGLAISVHGEVDQLLVPENAGRPDYALGNEFHAALTAAYRIDEVNEEIFANRAALIPFPGQPHPLQALLQEARGETLPMCSSLDVSCADRPPRRVLIWSADNDLFAGFEPDAIETIFSTAGIECVRRSGAGTQPADFVAAYADPSFDIVWVSGHGEIDHWRHGSARIMAGDDCFVGIDELVRATPRGDVRRLLMLNICDGGVAAVNGGIHRLGLAPMLAGRSQATISHLWPVRPLVAAAFGTLLASSIARGLGYFQAFAAALAALHRPSAQVATAVREAVPGAELVDRLEATDLETENIFHWGSPAFFQ